MASCQTTRVPSTAPYVKLTVTQSSSTATSATLSWTLQYISDSAARTSVNKDYSVTIAGSTVKSGNYNINGKKGTYTIASGTKTITKTTSVQTVSFGVSFGFALTWSGTYVGVKTASGSISVAAKTSYTIKYNANGGSGAPSSQTKWHGTALALSNTKPTRNGYEFQGWAETSTGSVVYKPGASYTENASKTLYAVWKAFTYTIKYDANGGSGAPSSQTKTYGVALTLSSTEPTRTNYEFLGWGLTPSATTVAYEAGDSYAKNAGITLYAIWSLAYTKPRITGLSVIRCTADKTADDDGTYALVQFGWECDQPVTEIKIWWKRSTETTWPDEDSLVVSANGTSGNVSTIIGSGDLSTEYTYDIWVDVFDNGGRSYKTVILEGAKFVIDLKAGGTGISFGKPAELSDYMDVGYKAHFRDKVRIDGEVEGDVWISGAICLYNDKAIYGKTVDGTDLRMLGMSTSNNTIIGYGGYSNNIGATNLYGNAINLYANGNVNVKAPLHLDVTTDAAGATNNNPALTIGPTSGAHLEFDGNEIMAKSSETTTTALWLNGDGGAVYINDCQMATNKVLWSGAFYMMASHEIGLDEAISSQANGVVLIWSWYENGAACDYSWSMTFVPKYFVSVVNGGGMSMRMSSGSGNTFAIKYLYIQDKKIIGYDYNVADAWTTTSGLKVTPKNFVLRYVIGV